MSSFNQNTDELEIAIFSIDYTLTLHTSVLLNVDYMWNVSHEMYIVQIMYIVY